MTIPALIPSNAVEINNGRPITTSLAVAEIFEKEHFHVLRDVRTLGCSPEFTASNFGFSDYKDSTGRTLPMVQMTKDGFTILAMGYTGAKAMQFKEAYIQRFNEMEASLRQGGQSPLPPSPVGHRRVLLVLRDNGTFEAKQVPDSAVMFAPEDLPNILADSTSGVFSRSLLPAIIGAAAERLAGLHPAARPHSINSTWPIEPPSIYDQVLMRVTAAKGQGLAVRELVSGCWAFRNLTSADRAKLINQMLQDQVLVEIGTTNKTGPRGKRLVAAGKGYQ